VDPAAPHQHVLRPDQVGRPEIARQQFLMSAGAFGDAAVTSPSPRILHQWGLAAARGGDLPTARRSYEMMLAKDSTGAIAWLSYANVTFLLRDWPASRRAASGASTYTTASTELLIPASSSSGASTTTSPASCSTSACRPARTTACGCASARAIRSGSCPRP